MLRFEDRFNASGADLIEDLGEPLLDVLFLWCNDIDEGAHCGGQINLWRSIEAMAQEHGKRFPGTVSPSTCRRIREGNDMMYLCWVRPLFALLTRPLLDEDCSNMLCKWLAVGGWWLVIYQLSTNSNDIYATVMMCNKMLY